MEHCKPSRRRRRSIVFPLVLSLLAMSGCEALTGSHTKERAESSDRQVYALGRLEPAAGLISISAIPGERLKVLDPDVVENERGPANGILGLLASYDLGRAQLQALEKKQQLAEKKQTHQLEITRAQLSQSQATLAQARAKQKELELQHRKLDALRTASEIAAAEYMALEELAATDPELVTRHQLEKQRNTMDLANHDFVVVDQSYETTKDAADKSVAAAEANVAVAKATLTQIQEEFEKQAIEQEIAIAKETLKRSVLLAPYVSAEDIEDVADIKCVPEHDEKNRERGPYTILKVFLQPGEFVTQTPIMQLGDLSKMICIAEVYEADVKEIVDGQQATIRSPAFDGKFADGPIDSETKRRTGGIQGKVTRIGGLIAPPGLSNRNPLAPADRSVVEVRIEITDPEAIAQAAERVGLQVTVEFGDKPADSESAE